MRNLLVPAAATAALVLSAAGAAFAAPPVYKVQTKIKIGGAARWDYVYVDSTNHRLYVAHSGADAVEVIDTVADKVVATIPNTKGVHGVAVANDLGKGYTSNGGSNDVVARTAPTPQGPWSPEQPLVSSFQMPGGIYAPMIHPWSSGKDLYFNLSLWSAYDVMLMHTVLP